MSRNERADRRRFYRVRLDDGVAHALEIELETAAGESYPAEPVDLSLGGAGLRFSRERQPDLDLGEVVRVRVRGPQLATPLVLDASVRARVQRDGLRRYGISFGVAERPPARRRVSDWLPGRRAQRAPLLPGQRVPVYLRDATGAEHAAILGDLSATGLGLRLEGQDPPALDPEAPYEVSIRLEGPGHTLRFGARLRHANNGPDGVRCGVELVPDHIDFARQRATALAQLLDQLTAHALPPTAV